ncbi:DUF1189 domain-containing protein [Anaerobacillus sp. MEB173]|uniref:DUF1189 domain-containing protein n=1 Tax=Anaerobacillus sp. MEB173 TaxID=3383345 RepID=UPI003F8D9FD5
MNVLKQFINSLYSPKDIAVFRFQGIGKTILYIFTFMFLVSIPTGFQLGTSISTNIQQLQHALVSDLPYFEMKNGILISDLDEPIILEEGNEVFIFDTTGAITADDLQQYDAAFAILKREAVIISTEPQTYPYKNFGNLSFSKAQLENVLSAVQNVLPIIITLILLLLYIVLTGLKFIGILFLSLISLVICKQSGKNLSYKQLWILCAYAVTLPTTLFAITDSLGLIIPFSLALYWVIAIYMLYLTIKAIPSPKPKTNNKEEEPIEL